MADDSLTVASAVVVVPEAEPTPPASPPRVKRRQSSVSEHDNSKRPRLSIDANTTNGNNNANSPLTATSADTPHGDNAAHDDDASRRVASRRKSGQVEERQRGKRLFGALLGTLSQTTTSVSQKRRADIEKKMIERRREEAEELDQQAKEKLERLMKVRKREQWRVDEETMRVRHEGVVNMARFLKTETEPVLYYKPWELLPEQDDTIKAQIEEAETTVLQEDEEFKRRREAEQEPEQEVGKAASPEAMDVTEKSTNGGVPSTESGAAPSDTDGKTEVRQDDLSPDRMDEDRNHSETGEAPKGNSNGIANTESATQLDPNHVHEHADEPLTTMAMEITNNEGKAVHTEDAPQPEPDMESEKEPELKLEQDQKQDQSQEQERDQAREPVDENGEVMVEGDEDTVIY